MKRDDKAFPQRPHHGTPAWVPDGAVFHIRVRCEPGSPPLTDMVIGNALLSSVRLLVERQKWSCFLFLAMPDHIHALLSFSRFLSMGRAIADWKRFHCTHSGILWQENYFDHRIRSGAEFEEKHSYILRNPVVKGLCREPNDWPWKLVALHNGVLPQF
jgi:REP element-mobilizing transposase RayT